MLANNWREMSRFISFKIPIHEMCNKLREKSIRKSRVSASSARPVEESFAAPSESFEKVQEADASRDMPGPA